MGSRRKAFHATMAVRDPREPVVFTAPSEKVHGTPLYCVPILNYQHRPERLPFLDGDWRRRRLKKKDIYYSRSPEVPIHSTHTLHNNIIILYNAGGPQYRNAGQSESIVFFFFFLHLTSYYSSSSSSGRYACLSFFSVRRQRLWSSSPA